MWNHYIDILAVLTNIQWSSVGDWCSEFLLKQAPQILTQFLFYSAKQNNMDNHMHIWHFSICQREVDSRQICQYSILCMWLNWKRKSRNLSCYHPMHRNDDTENARSHPLNPFVLIVVGIKAHGQWFAGNRYSHHCLLFRQQTTWSIAPCIHFAFGQYHRLWQKATASITSLLCSKVKISEIR